MNTYTIKKSYHWTDSNEIEISSENLIYTEAGKTHHGLQCNNFENHNLILQKCSQIADLIREIETLNVKKH